MKKSTYFLYSIFILAMMDCRCGFHRSGFQFSKLQQSLVSSYKLNDTIYFRNQYDDYDTMCISSIDSIDRYGAILGFSRKNIAVDIKHLPQNIWTDGVELSKDGKRKVLDQTLIVIEKSNIKDSNDIYIGVHYRDFYGDFRDTNKIIINQLLSDLGITNYWEIRTDSSRYSWIKKHEKEKSALITKIIWTEKFGLTAYYKENGDFYKIKIN